MTLAGPGAFRVPYGPALLQRPGDSSFPGLQALVCVLHAHNPGFRAVIWPGSPGYALSIHPHTRATSCQRLEVSVEWSMLRGRGSCMMPCIDLSHGVVTANDSESLCFGTDH